MFKNLQLAIIYEVIWLRAFGNVEFDRSRLVLSPSFLELAEYYRTGILPWRD